MIQDIKRKEVMWQKEKIGKQRSNNVPVSEASEVLPFIDSFWAFSIYLAEELMVGPDSLMSARL